MKVVSLAQHQGKLKEATATTSAASSAAAAQQQNILKTTKTASDTNV